MDFTNSDQRVNPVVLVESVYNFLSLYKLVSEDFKKRPQRIFVRADLRGMHSNGVKSYLLPHGTDSWGYPFVGREPDSAPDDDGTKTVEADTEDFDPREVAFRVVKEIYLWFGLEEDKIPYVTIENNARLIDLDAIKRLGHS